MRTLMELAAKKALQIHLDRNRDEASYREAKAIERECGCSPEELSRTAQAFVAKLAKTPPHGCAEQFALVSDFPLFKDDPQ
jgi:hypothetical protein